MAIFDSWGVRHPVTVLQLDECEVVQVRNGGKSYRHMRTSAGKDGGEGGTLSTGWRDWGKRAIDDRLVAPQRRDEGKTQD